MNIDFPNNPSVGDTFTSGGTVFRCVNVNPAVWTATPLADPIPDGPVNGLMYGRQNAAWQRSVAVAGDTMTGALVLYGNPAGILEAAPKQYVDLKVAALPIQTLPVTVAQGGTGATATPAALTNLTIPNHDKMKVQMPSPIANEDVVFFDTPSNNSHGYEVNSPTGMTSYFGALIAGVKRWQWNFTSASAIIYRMDATGGNPNAVMTADNGTGNVNFNASVSGASGMGIMFDGGSFNYMCMGAGLGAAWAWQWNRSNGVLRWLNSASASVFAIDGSGNIDGSWYRASSGQGLQCNGTQTDGSSYSLQSLVLGNPNWNVVDFRSRHQYGFWAGWEFIASPAGTQIRFTMSSGQAWGSIQAASFDVQSDERDKEGVTLLERQHDAFMEVQPIEWRWPTPPAAKPGDMPTYPDLRAKWGFSAQNLAKKVPLAVNGDVTAVDEKGKPLTAHVDPVPILAITVLEVQAMFEEIAALRERVSILEAPK